MLLLLFSVLNDKKNTIKTNVLKAEGYKTNHAFFSLETGSVCIGSKVTCMAFLKATFQLIKKGLCFDTTLQDFRCSKRCEVPQLKIIRSEEPKTRLCTVP